MKLKTFIDDAKLDLADMRFAIDGGTGYRTTSELRPEDFITFAKADFFKADTRGLINALSNAKRAIDCQADNFLATIGFESEKLDKQLGSHGIASVGFGRTSSDGPLKLRLLRALGIATPQIVDRLRRLRNLLEHEYKKPRKSEVSSAIDIAELFVQACRGKMNSTFDTVFFGSGRVKSDFGFDFESNVRVSFDYDSRPKCEVMLHRHDWHKTNPNREFPTIEIRMDDEGYVPLLKLVWHADWDNDMTEPLRAFLLELGFRLPLKFRVKRADLD
jgi:hypothetical protein